MEQTEEGDWVVPEEDLVKMPDGSTSQDDVMNDSLFGVCLYCESKDPKKQVWTDQYIEAHKNQIAQPAASSQTKRKRK